MPDPNEYYFSLLLKQIHIVTRENRLVRLLRNPFKPIYRRILESIAGGRIPFLKLNISTFWGDHMQIILPERSSSYMFKFGFWEEDVTAMMLKYLKSGDIFFDIGAHIGYFTLLGSRLVGPSGQVHSFEPSNWAFTTLKHNVHNKNNCTLNKKAAYSQETNLTFYDYGPTNSLYNSFFAINAKEDIAKALKPEKCEVPTLSLDNYADEKNIIPSMVKIDAETAEYDILLGMRNIIQKKKTIFIFEIGGFSRENTPSALKAAKYILNEGYHAYQYSRGEIIPYVLKNEDHYKNVLFLP